MTDVTVSAEALQEMIAKAVAGLQTKGGKEKKGRKPLTEEQKAERRAKVDIETLANFTVQGYKDVRPRDNVRTYDGWVRVGRQVKKGEKSTKCGPWPLFHRDQTDPLVFEPEANATGSESVN